MNNFTYHNPVKIVFGKETIGKLSTLIPREAKVLMLYGWGSIKKNGVFNQVMAALKNHTVQEFSGIEANPEYETLMKAAKLVKKEGIDFLLSVGGGSVLDGTKFVAAAARYTGSDPWDLLDKKTTIKVKEALPIGSVLTLAATGSEMNGFSVISRRERGEKLAFGSPLLFPEFSILDPETTFTLPQSQTANGVIDAFVHVMEQYLTYDVNAPLQDRQSEAVLKVLIEEGPKALARPTDYDVRANLMWCATHALNGNLSCGVPQDWATHMIGHEITAEYGLDHAQSLAVVMPVLIDNRKASKKEKFAHYARRVWHIIKEGDEAYAEGMKKTVEFFKQMGMKTKLNEYNIDRTGFENIANRLDARGVKLGEHQDIGKKEILDILNACY